MSDTATAPPETLDGDLTLDELRVALAPMVAENAAFDGWTDMAVRAAAEFEGVDPEIARLAYPGGPMDMVDAWIESVDAAMARELPQDVLATRKVRDRIRDLVRFRLEQAEGREEALRRAVSVMAMPQNAARAARIGWRSADRMWRLAGDTATDYNHYTKRAILSGVYASTLAVFLDDRSEGKADSWAFLDRRIDNVMQFEKVKARLTGGADRERFSLVRFLGRLRYPVD